MICARKRFTVAWCSSSAGPSSAVTSSFSAVSKAPARSVAWAAAKARLDARGRVRSQLGRPLQERGRGRDTAAALRPVGGGNQLGGDVLVGSVGCLGAVPGAAVGIEVRVDRLGEGLVHRAAIGRDRPPGTSPTAPADAGTGPAHRARSDRPPRRARPHSPGVQDPSARGAAAVRRRPARQPPSAAPAESPAAATAPAGRSSARSGSPTDAASGRSNPPASSAAVNPRGSSSNASGLPRVSATIRSRTCSSSRPGTTASSSAPASSSARPPTISSGKPRHSGAVAGSRTPNTTPIRSANRRRPTKVSAWAEA